MSRLQKLAEKINEISEEVLVEAAIAKGGDYGNAKAFFKNGRLPDGSSWGKSLGLRYGYDNDPSISNEKKTSTKDGLSYSARITFAPGKGGGAGITIDATASNHLFNMMGTDKSTIDDVSKAFGEYASSNSRTLDASFGRWLKDSENFLHHIVGWKNREKFIIMDVMFKSIKYGPAMVDPTRRKWPSGRTEIWIPVTADVVITLKEKG